MDTISGRRARPHTLGKLVAAAALTAAAVLGSAVPAGAASATYSPSAGTVATYARIATVSNTLIYIPNAGQAIALVFRAEGVVVKRSPAFSGTQTVTVSYAVQRWVSGRWETNAVTPAAYATLSSTSSQAAFPAQTISTGAFDGYVRVVYAVTWWAGSNLLGTALVQPTSSSETACATMTGWVDCTPNAGYVYVRLH